MGGIHFHHSHSHENDLQQYLLLAHDTPYSHHPQASPLIWIWSSFICNCLMLAGKSVAFYFSGSFAVLASLVDSCVDILSQGVITYTSSRVNHHDPAYPVGKTRLETVGIIACAIIMSIASFDVLSDSASALYRAVVSGDKPVIEAGELMLTIMGLSIAMKAVLFVGCYWSYRSTGNQTTRALAVDHGNDTCAGILSVLAAGASHFSPQKLWWTDPVGGLLISFIIIYNWTVMTKEQIDHLVGRGAPPHFVEQIAEVVSHHDPRLQLDTCKAYHFGLRYIVELEVVLPADMTIRDSHDIALLLQQKIETRAEVERCHVHVDYQARDEPEHRQDRVLEASRLASRSASTRNGAGHGGHLKASPAHSAHSLDHSPRKGAALGEEGRARPACVSVQTTPGHVRVERLSRDHEGHCHQHEGAAGVAARGQESRDTAAQAAGPPLATMPDLIDLESGRPFASPADPSQLSISIADTSYHTPQTPPSASVAPPLIDKSLSSLNRDIASQMLNASIGFGDLFAVSVQLFPDEAAARTPKGTKAAKG